MEMSRGYMPFLMIILSCLCVADSVSGQAKHASACSKMKTCGYPLVLGCSVDERVFIMRLLLGFKLVGSMCSKNPSCSTCCRPELNDRFENYPYNQFGEVYNKCWNHPSCTIQLQDGCSFCPSQHASSTFPVAEYVCIKAGNVIQFSTISTVTSSAVAIKYDPRQSHSYPVAKGHTKTWYCLVHAVTSSPCQVDVVLVKDRDNSRNKNSCSLVGWSGGPFLSCGTAFQYKRFNTSTPFWVNVTVNGANTFPSGWAVIKAQGGKMLRVTCGQVQAPTVRPAILTQTTRNSLTSFTSRFSSAVSAPGKTVHATHASSTAHTGIGVKSTVSSRRTSTMRTTQTTASSMLPRSSGTLPSPQLSTQWTSTSFVRRSTTTVLTTALTIPASEGNKLNKNKNADKSAGGAPNTGALVGGIVSAVMVVTLGGVAVFCFVKRYRKERGNDTKSTSRNRPSGHMALTSVNSTSSSRYLTCDSGTKKGPGQDGEDSVCYDRPRGIYKAPGGPTTSPGIHGNPRSPVEDPDYDRLGGKKPQSFSSNPAATYGRLGEVGGAGEGTDYSYDHLARGRQTASDVIDSVYATAGLHMTSEGDYSVADFHKRKRQVITGSDYDVAEVVTSGSDVTNEPSMHIRAGGAIYAVAKPIMTLSGDADYDEARSMAGPGEQNEYSSVIEYTNI